ncbi:MAG: carboxylating nicotinate-nucleotide diphosphorylase [Bacteroidota bacterium]|mgnify:FL=1|nr:carboxylating nicotinate-nucleotide diphosphorylase [Bacteroidota bacterium]MEC8599873.1 carboxylating nicotinate-nucleotide diphosphorylase [Bacteroidota bacterium]|tara:strand:- start:208 stop:1077 length:870 start_codon:yes stop_codon:yes gene_type:complete
MIKNFIKRYKNQLNFFIENALSEDIGIGDHTSLSCIDARMKSSAKLVVKQSGYIAGVALSKLIFEHYDPRLKVETIIKDGHKIRKGDIAFKVHGSTLSILSTERLVLNTIQRMSSIASLTKGLNKMISHTNCKILDTRKTTPNFRYAEKLAVMIGGGTNHRMGLFDAILIKDNHIDYCGGVKNTLTKTENYLKKINKELDVIVECRNQKEIDSALNFNFVNRILLDNYNPSELSKAISSINGRKSTEASGRIGKNNIIEYAETGVDFISIGELTNNLKSIDMSLKAMVN